MTEFPGNESLNKAESMCDKEGRAEADAAMRVIFGLGRTLCVQQETRDITDHDSATFYGFAANNGLNYRRLCGEYRFSLAFATAGAITFGHIQGRAFEKAI